MVSAIVGTRPPETYDAEYHLGLIAEDDNASVAEFNTTTLSAALNAQWAGGTFTFEAGPAGPLLRPITFAAKEFFFKGSIKTSTRAGGVMLGLGQPGHMLSSDQFGDLGTLGGMSTRFTRIDGAAGGAVLRLRGSCFHAEWIEFRGRPYASDLAYGPTTGTKTPSAIEVECRPAVLTGSHSIRNCLLSECTYGVRIRDGYYNDAGTFISGEQACDSGILDNVSFFGVNNCLRTENLLAVGWQLRDIVVSSWGGSGIIAVIVCDVARGGNISIDGLNINQRRTTLFQVQDYSANAQRLVCSNLRVAGVNVAGDDYLTLFKYNGIATNAIDLNWTVRIDGQIAGSATAPSYDSTKLIQVSESAANFPFDNVLIDVVNLPTNGFQRMGRWSVPTSALL